LQATIDTSSWSPPSPDPTGITWWTDRLLVVDSEVEETISGITHYEGANTYEASPSGTLERTSTTTAFSTEPTDVAAHGSRVFVSDDNRDRIFVIHVGPDGRLNTSDDTRTSIGTHAFGSYDDEAVSFAGGDLFAGDGTNTQIYRIDPGPDGAFGGTDDRVTCFDTRALGMRDPEGVTVDPATGRIYVASRISREIAVADGSGALLNLIDLRPILPYGGRDRIAPSGVTLAPAAEDPSRIDLYLTDRGVDNNTDPSEIYQIRRQSPDGNVAPVVSGFGALRAVEGERVSVRTVAADPNGDPLSYSATGLPPGLSIDPSSGLITGKVAAGAAAGSPYVSHVTVSDGSLATVRRARWRITTGAPDDRAPVISPTGDQRSTEGDPVALRIQASDPDVGQALMYSATGLPPGLWLDCTSGRIRGRVASGAASGSPYRVRVQVEDQTIPADPSFTSRFDQESFSWTVSAPGPSPSITFRDASKGSTPGPSRRLRIPSPSGVAPGDVLVAAIDVRGPARIGSPRGWVRVRADHRGHRLRQFVYVRVLTGDEPGTWRWRLSRRQPATGIIVGYRGVDPIDPIEVAAGRVKRRSRWITAPSVTAAEPSAMVVGMFGVAARAWIRPPRGMDERAEIRLRRSRRRITTEVSDRLLSDAGPTGRLVARATRAGTNIGQSLILRPAS
jgi:hypothetical protein